MATEDYEYVQLTFLWGGYLTTYASGTAGGRPELAKTVVPSDGFKVWTVKLKRHLKFSDGEALTANDVAATFNTLAKEKAVHDSSFVATFFENLKSVTTAGDSTTIFRFKNPDPDFAKQVAMPEMVILPAAGLAKGAAFWKHPISAGRYELKAADFVNGNYTFTANPNYVQGKPAVRQVVITSVPDAATRLAQLQSGQVDYAENLPGTLLPQIKGKLHVDPAPWAGGSLFLAPNETKGSLLSDARIRQAINVALDRKQISQAALGGDIAGKPLYGIPWNQTNTSPNVASFGPDLAKAKALLQGTACASGCTIPTTYLTNAVWQLPTTIQVVAQQLSKIGITLQLRGVTQFSDLFAKGWGLTIMWTGFYDDSASYLSNYYVAGGYQVFTGYAPPAMKSLGARMAVATPAKLPAMVAHANKLFAQYQPIIPLTTLTYLAGDSLPASELTNTQAAYLDIR